MDSYDAGELTARLTAFGIASNAIFGDINASLSVAQQALFNASSDANASRTLLGDALKDMLSHEKTFSAESQSSADQIHEAGRALMAPIGLVSAADLLHNLEVVYAQGVLSFTLLNVGAFVRYGVILRIASNIQLTASLAVMKGSLSHLDVGNVVEAVTTTAKDGVEAYKKALPQPNRTS